MRNGLNPFTRSNKASRVRRNTTKLLCLTPLSSVDSQAVQMQHPTRVVTRTDAIAAKIRVKAFEMVKQKCNSATKNITALFTEERFHRRESSITSGESRDDVRPHKQRPGKAEYDGRRFKTKDSVRIMKKICRLPKCYLGTHIRCDCHSPRLQGLLLFAFYDSIELGAGQSQYFQCWLLLRGSWRSVKKM